MYNCIQSNAKERKAGKNEKNGAVGVRIVAYDGDAAGLSVKESTDEPISEAEMAENGTEVSLDETTSVASEILQDTTVTVNVMVAGQEVSLCLDEYLSGVLAAEMPASFPEEALKAQAVAARSFILYRMQNPRRRRCP